MYVPSLCPNQSHRHESFALCRLPNAFQFTIMPKMRPPVSIALYETATFRPPSNVPILLSLLSVLLFIGQWPTMLSMTRQMYFNLFFTSFFLFLALAVSWITLRPFDRIDYYFRRRMQQVNWNRYTTQCRTCTSIYLWLDRVWFQ